MAKALDAKPGPLEYSRRWPLRLWVGAVILFLYLPLASLVVFSFNDSRRTIRWEGFTLDWYGTMWNDRR
ncbi:ABC transporter permease [Novosphingobium pokkalii]|jgi:spermidine/putrescine transport system permease protein|uniref:ABC transporter permease n=1 Tax=Novosphingobium pokkalii TaxID=1770194 RepID=UPI0036383F76